MASFSFPSLTPEKLQAITERLVEAGWVEKAAVTKDAGAAIVWTDEGDTRREEVLRILRTLKISGAELELLKSLGWLILFNADVLPILPGARNPDSN